MSKMSGTEITSARLEREYADYHKSLEGLVKSDGLKGVMQDMIGPENTEILRGTANLTFATGLLAELGGALEGMTTAVAGGNNLFSGIAEKLTNALGLKGGGDIMHFGANGNPISDPAITATPVEQAMAQKSPGVTSPGAAPGLDMGMGGMA